MAPIIDQNHFQSADIGFNIPGHTLSYYIENRELKPLTPVEISYILLGILNQLIAGHHAGILELNNDTIQTTVDACWDAIRS